MTSSFIHSGYFYSAPLVHYYSETLPTTARTYTVSEFHAEAHAQATVSKGLAQGPYVAARAGVEPTTLRLKVIDSTNAPPRPAMMGLPMMLASIDYDILTYHAE